MTEQKRVEWLDVARGLGMLLVIIGHTMTTPIRQASFSAYAVYNAVYFFHMPFMFYLSGRTFGMFRQRNCSYTPGVWIKKKWNTLMVPYLVYGVLVYLIFCLANCQEKLHEILEEAGYGTQSVFQWVYGVVIGDNLYTYHLWFIYALFLMNVFVYFLFRYGRYQKVLLFVLAFVCIGARVYVNTSNWGIANLFMKCFLWFVVGTFFDFSKIVKKSWAIVWMCFGIVYMVVYAGQLWDAIWKLPPIMQEMVKWVADVGILLFFVGLSMKLAGAVKQFFAFTGRNSFGIYLFHQPFFASGGGLVLYKVLGLPLVAAIVLTFILCYIGPIVILKCFDMPYLRGCKKYLLGLPTKKVDKR